jgi:hypothetical protein
MQIIPWHCHVCGNGFETPDGGLCFRCSKATCRKCLLSGIQNRQGAGKTTSGFVCTQCATPQEFNRAHPFNRIKLGNKARLVLKNIAIGIILLLTIGFFVDLFRGFYILKHSQSIYAGLSGLLIIAILYVTGEAGSKWIDSKDNVTHPFYKRAFHLFLLLLFAGLVLIVLWLVLKSLGVIKA